MLKVDVQGIHIIPNKHYIDWFGEGVTLFELGCCECDSDENVLDWIPIYLIDALRVEPRARVVHAIEDYIAGWQSVL